MQCNPHELKEKLLKGLDEENNVVDMAAVVAVISILEKYPMSRETLEQTRIGRYVNDLRKKTNDEQLAKRAKKLVKNWQTLINSSTPVVNGDNGERVVHPGVTNIKCNSPAFGSLSPALQKSSQYKRGPGSKPNTPSLPPLKPNTPTLQPNTPQSALKSKPNTPSMPRFTKHIVSPNVGIMPASSPKLHSTPKLINSPRVTIGGNPPLSPANISPVSSSCSRPSTPVDTPIRPPSATESNCRLTRNRSRDSLSSLNSEKLPNDSQHSSGMNGKSTNRRSDKRLSKTDIANRKRARLEYTGEMENKVSKIDNCETYSKVNGAVKSSSNSNTQKTNGSLSRSPSETSLNKSFPSRKNVNLSVNTEIPFDKSKTPKVKTTAQLIAELQAKSGSSSVGSDVIKQIETNQIIKESDVPESALPPGARPKRNKKRGLDPSLLDTQNQSHATLSQTKSELVEKYLQTSITPSTGMDMSPFKYEDRSESLESGRAEGSSLEVDSSGGDMRGRLDEVKSQESRSVKVPTLDEIMGNLPPVDVNNVLDDDIYDIPDRGSVTDEIVNKLHNDEWTNVNGNYDPDGVWHDWTQMYTNLSYSEEPLHILPYVLIDD